MGNCTSRADGVSNDDDNQSASLNNNVASTQPPPTSISVNSQSTVTGTQEGAATCVGVATAKRESVFSVPVFNVTIPHTDASNNANDSIVCSNENPLDPARRRSSGKSTASKRTSTSSRRTSNEKRTSMTSDERQVRAAQFCSTIEAPWSSVASSPTHRWSGTLGNLDGLTERSFSNTRNSDRQYTTESQSNVDVSTGTGLEPRREGCRNVKVDSDSDCDSVASTVMVVNSEEHIVFRPSKHITA